ncbi:hypothetical protein NDU88_007124 [Pleurodeles waltl]|uniref:Uncharacterized protein n=1 Tax=Pleurodeles waltl TaxID=8319 RepID=A0AAV7NVW2_PLEWA|nr:hypothetical protein NDU88_007124 [Pleurodeles waltl]
MRTCGKEDMGPETAERQEHNEAKSVADRLAVPEPSWRAEGGGVWTSRARHVPGGMWLEKVWSFWYRDMTKKSREGGEEEEWRDNTLRAAFVWVPMDETLSRSPTHRATAWFSLHN